MPIYELDGVHYDLPDGLTNAQAKQKIIDYKTQQIAKNALGSVGVTMKTDNSEDSKQNENIFKSVGRGFFSGANRVADALDAAAVAIGADPKETYDDQASRHAYWNEAFAQSDNEKQGVGNKIVSGLAQLPYLANAPLAGMSAVGGGVGEAKDVIDQGGDVGTARDSLAVSSLINAASNMIPILGKTGLQKVMFGAVSNPAGSLVDQEAQRALKEANNLNPGERMGIDDILAQSLTGAAFGAMHSNTTKAVDAPEAKPNEQQSRPKASVDADRAAMQFDELRKNIEDSGKPVNDLWTSIGTGSLKQIARIKDNPYLKWTSSKIEQAKNEVGEFASKFVSGKEFTHSNKPVLDLSRSKKTMNQDAIIPQLERFDTKEKMADLSTYLLDLQDGKAPTVPVTPEMVKFKEVFRTFTDNALTEINNLRTSLGQEPIAYKPDYFPLTRHEQKVITVKDSEGNTNSFDIVPGKESEILADVSARYPGAKIDVVNKVNDDLGYAGAAEYFNRLQADPKFGYSDHAKYSENKRGTFALTDKNIVGDYMGRTVESYINATLHYMEALNLEKKITGLREDTAFRDANPKTASLMEKYIQQAQYKLVPNSVGRAGNEIARTISNILTMNKNPFLVKNVNDTFAKAFNYKIAFNVPKQFLGSAFQMITTGIPHLAAVANDSGLNAVHALNSLPQAMMDFYNQTPRYREIVKAAFQSGIIDQTRRLEVNDTDVNRSGIGRFVDKLANQAAEIGEYPQQQARVIYMLAADKLFEQAIPDPKKRLQVVFDSVSVAMVDARNHDRGTALSGMGDFKSVARSTTTYAANITHTMTEFARRAVVDKEFAPIALHLLGTTAIAGLAGNVAVSIADEAKRLMDVVLGTFDKNYAPSASLKDQIQADPELSTWIKFGGLDGVTGYNISEGLSTDVGIPVALPYSWGSSIIKDVAQGNIQKAIERAVPSTISNTIKKYTQEGENYKNSVTNRLTSQDFRDTILGIPSTKNVVAGATDRVAFAQDRKFTLGRDKLISTGVNLVTSGKADGKLSPMIREFATEWKLNSEQIQSIVDTIISRSNGSQNTPFINDATSNLIYRKERAASNAAK